MTLSWKEGRNERQTVGGPCIPKRCQLARGENAPLLQDIQAGKQDSKAFQDAMFISILATAQWIHIQRLSPKNKGAFLYIPLQAGYRSKKQFNPYMVICNFIGYFTFNAM
jgi:hypothetical protein